MIAWDSIRQSEMSLGICFSYVVIIIRIFVVEMEFFSYFPTRNNEQDKLHSILWSSIHPGGHNYPAGVYRLSVCLCDYLSISVCLSMSLKPFSGCINFKWPPIHGIELKSLSTEPTRPGPGRHLSSLIGGRWCWGCGEDEATADSEIVIYFSRASTLAHHSWGVVVLFHWIMNIPP